jgi:hypothetical protein
MALEIGGRKHWKEEFISLTRRKYLHNGFVLKSEADRFKNMKAEKMAQPQEKPDGEDFFESEYERYMEYLETGDYYD